MWKGYDVTYRWTDSKAHSSYKVQNSDFTWRNLEKLTILLSKPLILSVSSAATVLSNISVKICVNYELREVTLNMCLSKICQLLTVNIN